MFEPPPDRRHLEQHLFRQRARESEICRPLVRGDLSPAAQAHGGAVTPHREVRQRDNIRLRAEARPDQLRGYPARAAGGVRLPARPDAHRLGARGVEQTLQRRAGAVYAPGHLALNVRASLKR